jgi:hypothetical protein
VLRVWGRSLGMKGAGCRVQELLLGSGPDITQRVSKECGPGPRAPARCVGLSEIDILSQENRTVESTSSRTMTRACTNHPPKSQDVAPTSRMASYVAVTENIKETYVALTDYRDTFIP